MRTHDTLLRKKNIVLEGPPGVGKTLSARRLAQAIVGGSVAHRVEMVQFHPSYSYEEFVRGSRLGLKGHIDGVFVRFCLRRGTIRVTATPSSSTRSTGATRSRYSASS
jgi:5-methylcytosine-specific restriction protein B